MSRIWSLIKRKKQESEAAKILFLQILVLIGSTVFLYEHR